MNIEEIIEKQLVIEIMKSSAGKTIYYDPQLGTELNERELDDMDYSKFSTIMFRVDDKALNISLINQISKRSSGRW